ncbi:GerMN domain-containing protein [Irregularibacter muris]|uniref:GerMN domain-containing protein n=1 Tax=Irregularibacter muris TaxID=1796619 RepID=A0AAE3HF63_9FIRM|nr:GerMN domain-containing protein [Irregularibacter muris]MCR1898991.1 GerMN domain-containing protein [Irregularibacter muris]
MKRKPLILFVFLMAITLIFTLSGCTSYDQAKTPLSQGEKQEEDKNQQETVLEKQGEDNQKEEPKAEQKEEQNQEPKEQPKEEQKEKPKEENSKSKDQAVKPKPKNPEKEEPKLEQKQESNKNSNQVISPKPNAQEREIVLYFMDKKIIETGQGKYSNMIKETRKVKVSDQPLEKVIIEALKAGPTSNLGATMLKKDLQVISVEVADKTAYVNLSSQNLFGSSLQETGLIYQIVYSLTEQNGIEKVQFLVDGTKRESLFGHYDIQAPWTKAMLQ